MHVSQKHCEGALRVGWGVPVAVIAPPHAAAAISHTIARQGGIILDPHGGIAAAARVVVIDTEVCGGEDAIALFVAALRRNRPDLGVILLFRDCSEQIFPPRHTRAPLRLRAPLSAVALRTAFEYLFGNENGAPRIAERPVFG